MLVSRKMYVAVDTHGRILCGRRGRDIRWLSPEEIRSNTYVNMFCSLSRAKFVLKQKIGECMTNDGSVMIVPINETLDLGLLYSCSLNNMV